MEKEYNKSKILLIIIVATIVVVLGLIIIISNNQKNSSENINSNTQGNIAIEIPEEPEDEPFSTIHTPAEGEEDSITTFKPTK